MFVLRCILLFVLAQASLCAAGPETNALFMRVIDVGPGLCCAIKSPDGHYMIYDAGRSAKNLAQLKRIIPAGSVIDLLVISHYDDDHIALVSKICQEYTIKTALHNGMVRQNDEWRVVTNAIARAPGCLDLNLGQTNVEFGRVFPIGAATATFVCGFNAPLPDWPLKDNSESNNAVSIVMRLDYAGKSILLTGDAVGRHLWSKDTNSIASEKFMIDHTNTVPIRANVLIAPHHGADNGSSIDFIRAVDPKYVVFSAGHRFNHPTEAAAQRYLAAGVWIKDMFRTDYGDRETIKEWNDGHATGTPDEADDDDVDININENGTISIVYVDSSPPVTTPRRAPRRAPRNR